MCRSDACVSQRQVEAYIICVYVNGEWAHQSKFRCKTVTDIISSTSSCCKRKPGRELTMTLVAPASYFRGGRMAGCLAHSVIATVERLDGQYAIRLPRDITPPRGYKKHPGRHKKYPGGHKEDIRSNIPGMSRSGCFFNPEKRETTDTPRNTTIRVSIVCANKRF